MDLPMRISKYQCGTYCNMVYLAHTISFGTVEPSQLYMFIMACLMVQAIHHSLTRAVEIISELHIWHKWQSLIYWCTKNFKIATSRGSIPFRSVLKSPELNSSHLDKGKEGPWDLGLWSCHSSIIHIYQLLTTWNLTNVHFKWLCKNLEYQCWYEVGGCFVLYTCMSFVCVQWCPICVVCTVLVFLSSWHVHTY